jgi:hypothetical protein
MSRSRLLIAALAALVLLPAPRPARAQQGPQRIDAIGTLDYAHGRSTIQVGSWVKYHVIAKSDLGAIDDYTVTQLIAGEEEFWGEDCFWVETWIDTPSKSSSITASLMSYGIFDDSLAASHLQLYIRKKVLGIDENDKPIIQPYRFPANALQSRNPLGDVAHVNVDSLGTDSVKTPKGEFLCQKVRVERGRSQTTDVGDSTQYIEGREVHVSYFTPQVPLTHVARQELDTGYWQRTWLIGRSRDSGPLRVYDRSKGTVELVDFGAGGLTPEMTPEYARHTLAEERAAAARKSASPAPAPTPLPPPVSRRKTPR